MADETGTNDNVKDSAGKTPLNAAAEWGYEDVVELLKAHGAK